MIDVWTEIRLAQERAAARFMLSSNPLLDVSPMPEWFIHDLLGFGYEPYRKRKLRIKIEAQHKNIVSQCYLCGGFNG